ESGDVVVADQIEESDHVVRDEGDDIVRIGDKVPSTVAEKAKGAGKKRKELFEQSTLNVEVGVVAAATVPFVTSFVSLTPEHEGGRPTDSIFGIDLRTRHPAERFVISSDSSHDSNENAADDEVSLVVRSLILNPPIMTIVVATMVAANISSTLVPRAGDKLVRANIFTDSAFVGTVGPDVAGSSQHVSTELSADSFYVSQDMDSEMSPQIYVPKWNVLNESALDDSNACHGLVDHLAPPVLFPSYAAWILTSYLLSLTLGLRARHVLALRLGCGSIIPLWRRRDLREAKAKEEIRLRGQVATIEAAEVCMLEGTYFGLHDEVTGYKLFKEQIEALQDEQVRVPSDCVAGLDSDLIKMALHINEESYPHYLTTIAGQRWILGRGLKLAVLKCLKSSEYLVALGGSIGLAINKGMQDGLAAGIDHGKVGRGRIDLSAYNPSAEANYVSAIDALRVGHAAETLEAIQLQPSPEQLMLLIYRLEDQLNLVGETSTSRVPAVVTTTTLSTTFIQASTVLPVAVTGHEAFDVGPSTKAPSPSNIMFEQEELETTPKHTTAS
nr:hypothetical protein [Tanacetum cinerariifolium]